MWAGSRKVAGSSAASDVVDQAITAWLKQNGD